MTEANKRQLNNALIVFSREPEAGKTKTRMMPYLTPEQCAELHTCLLQDLGLELRAASCDVFVCYTSNTEATPVLSRSFPYAKGFFVQEGDDLGTRMHNAFDELLGRGYEKCILIGTDIPGMNTEAIEQAFAELDKSDLVIGPTEDGGYCLVGVKKADKRIFEVKGYGGSSALENTLAAIAAAELSVSLIGEFADLDTPEDLRAYRKRMRNDPRGKAGATARFCLRTLKVSIIIPVYNEVLTIVELQKQLPKGRDDVEVIFVNGESTDGSVDLIEDGFKVIDAPKGRARQMNAGAKESVGDVLFFLHCDSVLPEGYIEEIKRVMEGSDYGCFGVRFESRHPFMLSNTIISNHRAYRRGIPFGDQGVFIDRDLFFEMGAYPEEPFLEDYIFSLKLKENGLKPAKTRGRITTSARRYGKTTLSIMKTEYKMWELRRRYHKGESPAQLVAEYRDDRPQAKSSEDGKVYYTVYQQWSEKRKMTAGPKGMGDIHTIAEECGVESLYIPSYRTGRIQSRRERVKQQRKVHRTWVNACAKLEAGDTLLIDVPLQERFVGLGSVIRDLKRRGVKIAVLICDLDLIRNSLSLNAGKIKGALIKKSELDLIKSAEVIISHNRFYEAKLREFGVEGRVENFEIFDYLAPDFDQENANAKNEGKDGAIIIAGNLDPAKTAYLDELPSGIKFNLYGVNYNGKPMSNVCYKGALKPEELLHNMEGSYGLVWDGDSAKTCSGRYGEYMRYNNPHKTSLYLAAGIPVVVWKDAAIAEFIEDNDCGISVSSIEEIESIIERISEERYTELKLNAESAGKRLREGYYTRNVIKRAFDIGQNY